VQGVRLGVGYDCQACALCPEKSGARAFFSGAWASLSGAGIEMVGINRKGRERLEKGRGVRDRETAARVLLVWRRRLYLLQSPVYTASIYIASIYLLQSPVSFQVLTLNPLLPLLLSSRSLLVRRRLGARLSRLGGGWAPSYALPPLKP
jgi:hypothetical protein